MAEQVLVPDVGEAEEVTVVEVLVKVGDTVSKDDSLVVLESEKASMEVPSPYAGKVSSINLKEGDTVNEGDLIAEIETGGSEAEQSGPEETQTEPEAIEEDAEAGTDADTETEAGETETETSEDEKETAAGEKVMQTVTVSDVGNAEEIVAVELLVKVGDRVEEGDSLVVLESEKASMEVPAPAAGVVQEILVSEGQQVERGDPLLTMETEAAGKQQEGKPQQSEREATPAAEEVHEPADEKPAAPGPSSTPAGPKVHAGPAVRKQAREYGVDLTQVEGSGRNGRIVKEDVQVWVKQRLSGAGQTGIPAIPSQDFSKYGETETISLSRVRKTSGRNLHRSWLNVPHVTQFDEADITDLEAFRQSWNEQHRDEGVKITPLAFLIKVCANALIAHPNFNSSLDETGENRIRKKYYNIGIAVDTDEGLVVPVIRDADKKGVVQLARESAELAAQARDKKLPLDAMQGATFSISSLGGIGGTAFTPVVNAPEVAILGVSRSRVAPVFDGESFVPRTLLPLSLSYDHRAIDGAEAVRFTKWLAGALGDIRRLLM